MDSGKLRYAYRDFPSAGLHPYATKAAQAARCAGEQGKYWPMHDRLFANQKGPQAEKLPAHAEAIGLDVTSFVNASTRAAMLRPCRRMSSRLSRLA